MQKKCGRRGGQRDSENEYVTCHFMFEDGKSSMAGNAESSFLADRTIRDQGS